jgi:hypothetical protein
MGMFLMGGASRIPMALKKVYSKPASLCVYPDHGRPGFQIIPYSEKLKDNLFLTIKNER